MIAIVITLFLAAQAISTMLLAGYTRNKPQRDILWGVSALFWIAAGIWRLK
jgi:uncharacterized membrane protein